MLKYGEVAILAVELLRTDSSLTPRAAWDKAAEHHLETVALIEKNCPKSTFLSLCQEGFVVGVPAGDYTDARENFGHAMEAVKQLRLEPGLAKRDAAELWQLVLGADKKAHNSQMHVVLALWNNHYIV